jgi:homoserine dehydrogenase
VLESQMPPLNVAIVGLGTVGSGVARVLLEHPDRIARRCGRPVLLRRAVVRDLSKPRDVSLPHELLTDDVRRVIDDPAIDVVVQLVGGLEPARTFLLSALQAGKDVVTANKALIYEHGGEVFRAARDAGRVVAFEASVCGGIPVIAAIGQSLAANQILSIEAILNGTSNFILTGMFSDRVDYAEMIRRAQDAGYAEADPAMDVDGTDAAQKLVILTQLAFGTRGTISDFTVRGIDSLELADLLYADELGYAVKLLAVSKVAGGELEMHVQPTLIRKDRPLAGIGSVYNQVSIEGDVVGRTWISGMGAGRYPTASAVLADLIDVAVGRAALTFPRLDVWEEHPPVPVKPAEDVEARYYLRFNVEDRPHVFADIADILGRNQISLASIIQHEAPEVDETDVPDSNGLPVVPVVVMTHRTSEGRFRGAERDLQQLTTLRPPWVRMPVAD